MVDYTRPMDKDHMLPFGRLRDNVKQKRRAHYVVVTKCPADMTPLDRRITRMRLELLPFQCLYFTRPASTELRAAFPDDAGERSVHAGNTVVAMAALGNPTPFVEGLKARYDVGGELLFPDHHPYNTRDVRKMEAALARQPEGTVIVTTEKDVVKLGSGGKIPAGLRARIFVQPLQMMFVEDSREDFFKTIDYDVNTDSKDSFFYLR
jgi:tetraacyldisaccharide 4'-kinase